MTACKITGHMKKNKMKKKNVMKSKLKSSNSSFKYCVLFFWNSNDNQDSDKKWFHKKWMKKWKCHASLKDSPCMCYILLTWSVNIFKRTKKVYHIIWRRVCRWSFFLQWYTHWSHVWVLATEHTVYPLLFKEY